MNPRKMMASAHLFKNHLNSSAYLHRPRKTLSGTESQTQNKLYTLHARSLDCALDERVRLAYKAQSTSCGMLILIR